MFSFRGGGHHAHGPPPPRMQETLAAPRLKILLVDDDELIAATLRGYLAGHGCDVDVACDLATAESLLVWQTYSTVMVDPYLTGAVETDRLALLDAVRTMQPDASLIVVTAYATPAIADSLSAGRIHTLLIKPRSIAELGRAALGAPLSPSPTPFSSPVKGIE
jgi:DNA-binding NtrC family response regulator